MCRGVNASIASSLTSYPLENPKVFDSSPSLTTSSDSTDPTSTTTNNTGVIVGCESVLCSHDFILTISFAAVVGGIGAIALSVAIFFIYSFLKKPENQGKVTLRSNMPREEEFPLSPGPRSPPIITRVSPIRHQQYYLN